MRLVYRLYVLAVISLLLFYSCNDETTIPITGGIDNTNNGFQSKAVAEIFANNCATSGCHSGNNPSSGLSIDNYSELLKGSSDRSGGTIPNYGGDVVIPLRLEESLLYQMLMNNVTPAAPHDGLVLTQDQINTIKEWIENGARDYNNNLPFSNPGYRIYVCNQGSDAISVIDGDAKVVSALIDVDFLPVLDSPHYVEAEDGFIYVTLIAAGKLLKISTVDYSIVGEVSGITKAGMIQISPDGSKAYISRSSTSDPIFQSVYAVDLAGMTIMKEINLGAPGVPHGMGITPDGFKLYVANLTLDRIGIVNGITDEYGDYDDIVLPQGTQPMQANVSPDGKYLYICARGTAKLLVYDTSTDSLVTEIPVSGMPMHIAITSDGNKIYVGSMMMHNVNVIQKNGETWTKIKEITHPGFRMLHGCDITSDDKYVYVSSRNNDGGFSPYFKVTGENNRSTIGIIDTQTDEVIKLIEIEEFGTAISIED
ncbi:MAG: beta-propeller fold lactonase family protein [Ignavibacteria bacterium]|nr:beta-propeller fold lactonase family protein [Ignavibacteria bacterium]